MLGVTLSLGASHPSVPDTRLLPGTRRPVALKGRPRAGGCVEDGVCPRTRRLLPPTAPAAPQQAHYLTEPYSGAQMSFNRTPGFGKPGPLYFYLISIQSRVSLLPGPLGAPTAASPWARAAAAMPMPWESCGGSLRSAKELLRAVNPLEACTKRHRHHAQRITSGAGHDGRDGRARHQATFTC